MKIELEQQEREMIFTHVKRIVKNQLDKDSHGDYEESINIEPFMVVDLKVILSKIYAYEENEDSEVRANVRCRFSVRGYGYIIVSELIGGDFWEELKETIENTLLQSEPSMLRKVIVNS